LARKSSPKGPKQPQGARPNPAEPPRGVPRGLGPAGGYVFSKRGGGAPRAGNGFFEGGLLPRGCRAPVGGWGPRDPPPPKPRGPWGGGGGGGGTRPFFHGPVPPRPGGRVFPTGGISGGVGGFPLKTKPSFLGPPRGAPKCFFFFSRNPGFRKGFPPEGGPEGPPRGGVFEKQVPNCVFGTEARGITVWGPPAQTFWPMSAPPGRNFQGRGGPGRSGQRFF